MYNAPSRGPSDCSQPAAGRLDVKPFGQQLVRFHRVNALGKRLAHRLGGLDPAHGAPHRRRRQKAHHRPVDGCFHRPGGHPLPLPRALSLLGQAAHVFPAQAIPLGLHPGHKGPFRLFQAAAHPAAAAIGRQAVALFGQQAGQRLMHRSLQRAIFQNYLHCCSAMSMLRLMWRSTSRVVASSWPGSTR